MSALPGLTVIQTTYRSGFGFHGTAVSDLEPGDVIRPPNEMGRLAPMGGPDDLTYYWDASAPNAMERAAFWAQLAALGAGRGVATVYLTQAVGPSTVDHSPDVETYARACGRQIVLAKLWQLPGLDHPMIALRHRSIIEAG